MEEELKKLLRDMKENENTRKNAISEINAEMSRIDLREETETERFIGTKDEKGNLRKDGGIYNDINAGLYNHITDGQMQKIIDEELKKIKAKYDAQRVELNNKLDDTKKQQEKEKANDYKEISSAIKEYHLDMVLEVNKANKALVLLETERNEKLKELDEKIAKKEAEQTHMIMKNHNFMDIESSQASVDIRALGQDIEELKATREMLDKEYGSKLEAQSNTVKYYSEQKERAGKFLGSIILSDKSIDEIYELLFDKDVEQEVEQENQSLNQTTNEQEVEQENESSNQTTNEQEVGQENQSSNRATNNANEQENRQENRRQENQSSSYRTNNENEQENVSKNKKFSYEFSMKTGIKYDGQDIDTNTLLLWYDERKEDIENVVKEALGDKEECEYFLTHSDKLVYLSMIFKDATIADDGKITLNDQTKQRLETYYDIWENPKSQEECDMEIKYDLRGMSKIQRFFSQSELTDEEVSDIKNNACLLRNRKNVSIKKGLLTTLQYKIMDMIENARDIKKIEERTGETISENNSHEKFVNRLDPKNSEYTQTNDEADRTATTVERTNDGR